MRARRASWNDVAACERRCGASPRTWNEATALPLSYPATAAVGRSYIVIAFTAKASMLPLYPVVGIDSHLEVTFNFVPFSGSRTHTPTNRPSPSSSLLWERVVHVMLVV